MMLKTLFPTALLALCSLTTHAQRDARVQLQLGNWSSPNDIKGLSFNEGIVNSVGISAEHRIYKQLYIKATIESWASFNSSTQPTFTHEKTRYEPVGGHFGYRENNLMIHISATYRFILGRHNELYAGAGPAVTVGTDYSSGGGSETTDAIHYAVKKVDFGAAWEAGYNYNFTYQRLNIGTSISGQHYAADFNLYTVKLNLGYNFNILKHKNKAQ